LRTTLFLALWLAQIKYTFVMRISGSGYGAKALAGLPVVLYAAFFLELAKNVNYFAYDDIVVLDIIEKWHAISSLSQKLYHLSLGFAEHHIIFSRSIVLLLHAATGEVNLFHLMLFSNALWVGQLVVLYGVFRRLKLPLLYFVPLCWLLINVHSFENMFWATSSSSNFGVLFFVVLAAYFYTHTTHIFVALACSVLATFSYGNGILTFFIALLFFGFMQRWRFFVITLVAFVVVWAVYRSLPSHSYPNPVNISTLKDFGSVLLAFFAFIGSSINVHPYSYKLSDVWASAIFGGIIFASILYALRQSWLPILKGKFSEMKSLTQAQQFAVFLLLFVCISALGVAYKRLDADGLVGMLKGRYRIYPAWFLSCGYLLLLTYQGRVRTLKWTLPASILLNLLILYHCIAPAANNRRAAVAQEFNSMHNADWNGLYMFKMSQSYFLKIQQLYKPNLFFMELMPQFKAPTDLLAASQQWPIDSVYQKNGDLIIAWGRGVLRPQANFDDGAYLILKSATHVYMAAGQQWAMPLKTFVRRGLYWEPGFVGSFNMISIKPGQYRLYVLMRQNGRNQLYDTTRRVAI
jgi:hypothetical protein